MRLSSARRPITPDGGPIKQLFDERLTFTRNSMEVGAAFSSAANIGGGNETTIMGIIEAMLIAGLVVHGDPEGDHYGPVSINKPMAGSNDNVSAVTENRGIDQEAPLATGLPWADTGAVSGNCSASVAGGGCSGGVATALRQKLDFADDSLSDPRGSEAGCHTGLVVKTKPGSIAMDERDLIGDTEIFQISAPASDDRAEPLTA